MIGFADREPSLPPRSLADMVGGLAGFAAVLAALRARDQGGQGTQMVCGL